MLKKATAIFPKPADNQHMRIPLCKCCNRFILHQVVQVHCKRPGKLCICIDPRDLNKAIKQAHYIMPSLKDIIPNLANAKVFSVFNA